jgi:hypothetical protein
MEISAKCYIDKMIDTYVQLYGEKPQQFQSLIGAIQWAVSIGRLDIATAVMSLSSFHAMPRRGHLERAKRIYGSDILSKHWAYALVWRTMNALLFAQGDTWDLLDDECGEE